MLGARHFDAAGLGQGDADGVGTAVPFMPRGSGNQRRALGLAAKIRVAQSLQQRAAIVGQDDHAAGMADLREQMLHHRTRVGEQFVVALQHPAQVMPAEVRCRIRRAPGRRQAGFEAAPP
jgi:hypothetical protein